jgi:hypothetical protein
MGPSPVEIASYTLDGGSPNTVNIPPSTPASPNITGDLSWNYQLFTVPASDSGLHTLTVTALQPNMLYLDFFLVLSPTAFIPTGNVSTAVVTPSPKGDPSTGAIVGGTIGGVVLLVGLILITILFRRRRRLEGQFDSPDPNRINYGKHMNHPNNR